MGVRVEYIQADMRRIDFQEAFDLVLLLFTAFGYFEDQENLLVLQNISRALKPHGRLVFDINNRDVFLKYMLPAVVVEREGNLMIDRIRFDQLTGRLHNRRLTIRDGVRKERPFFVRLYNPQEIQSLLREAGMEAVNFYGGWDLQALTADSRRLITIAQKA